MRAALVAILLGIAVVAVPVPAVSAATPTTSIQKVGLIGDSTILGLTYNPTAGRNTDARSVISAKYEIFWGVASCQRLVAPSCGRNPPPPALQVMQSNAGQLGQVIVVMGGYDDAEISTGVDAIVAEAARQGISKVIWLTYRTGDLSYQYADNYVGFNAVLQAKAQQHPSLVLADWDGHSKNHPEWMTADGVHVNATGAFALANFILGEIDKLNASRCDGQTLGDPAPPPSASAASPGSGGGFRSTSPRRVLDTRPGDGDAFERPLGAGRSMRVELGNWGVHVAAVNLTAVDPCGAGYLTAYRCDSSPPLVSNVNYRAGRTTASAATVPLVEDAFCIYSYATTDVIVDVFGHYGWAGGPGHPISGVGYTPLTPIRLVDTRDGAPASALRGPLTANTPVRLWVEGTSGVPAVAAAVSLNLTAVSPPAAVYVTAYPCSEAPPLVSNVNAEAGAIVANRVVVSLDTDGALCLVANGTVDVVVDVTGVYGDGGGHYGAATPTRLADTRQTGRLADGGELAVTVPGGGDAASVSVTAVNPRAAGFLTVAPCGTRPLASTLNYVAGDLVTNVADTPLDAAGRLCVRTSVATDVVVDLAGVFR